MKVSIIIPVYNVAPYIKRCLTSALNQTYQNIDIILVDDCGTDNSMDIANQVIQNHPNGKNVKVITHEFNRGLSGARNTGIKKAEGDYIYFLDSDDEISLNCIELLIEPALKYKTDFVIGDYESIGSRPCSIILKLATGNIFTNEEILEHFRNSNWYLMAWNKLINKNFLINKDLYFEEGIIHEDDLWSFKLACEASSMSIVCSKTYKYYFRDNSIMSQVNLKSCNSRIQIIEFINNYILKFNRLSNNATVYNIVEIIKINTFISLAKSNYYSKKQLYNIYIYLRKNTYLSPCERYYKFGFFIRRYLRDLHYLLPSYIGFVYFNALINIAQYLSAIRNR